MDEINQFVAAFFDEPKPPRAGNGNPLLIPRGVDILDRNRVEYSRASSLADVFEDHFHLWKWKMRGLAKGLADSIDLIRLASAERYTCGFPPVDPRAEGETDRAYRSRVQAAEAANRQAGKNLDEIIERAMDRAGIAMKADYGTAIHLRTEPDNAEIDPDEKQERDVASCWDLWAEMRVVHIGTEVFTANDELRSAGTFDHLDYVPGLGIVVTDKKTSSKAKSSYDVQLAGYSRSDVYDPETDQRQTLEEYVAERGWDPALINRSKGIIWWIKDGRTQARILDLDAGYEAAKVAAWVRDNRRNMPVAKDVTKDLLQDTRDLQARLLEALRVSPDPAAIWSNPAAQAIWTDEHTEAASARKKELGQ